MLDAVLKVRADKLMNVCGSLKESESSIDRTLSRF